MVLDSYDKPNTNYLCTLLFYQRSFAAIHIIHIIWYHRSISYGLKDIYSIVINNDHNYL